MFEETDTPYALCHCVTQQRIQDMNMGGDRKGIEGLSSTSLRMHFGISLWCQWLWYLPALSSRKFAFHQGRPFYISSQRIVGSAKW